MGTTEESRFHLNKPAIALAIVIAVAAFSLFKTKLKTPKSDGELFRQYPIMGTMAAVKLYGDSAATEKAADAIHDEFKRIESICNRFDPESELSRLNATAADKPFVCSPTLWNILLLARRFHKLSEGAFDPTDKPLMDLWGFHNDRRRRPTEEEIAETLRFIGMDKVIFDPSDRSITFAKSDVSLDLGGIAKGYAVDRAADTAKSVGIRSGVINLGGNIYCFPVPPPGKTAYAIGVRDPFRKDAICGTVEVLNRSIATSGDYERFVILEGERYSHIMNVKTGQPVRNTLSATVITPLAVHADALSTSAYVNGADFARGVSERIPTTDFLLIQRDENAPNGVNVTAIGDVWSNLDAFNFDAPR